MGKSFRSSCRNMFPLGIPPKIREYLQNYFANFPRSWFEYCPRSFLKKVFPRISSQFVWENLPRAYMIPPLAPSRIPTVISSTISLGISRSRFWNFFRKLIWILVPFKLLSGVFGVPSRIPSRVLVRVPHQ